MKIFKIFWPLFLFTIVVTGVSAQESSTSKAANKLYEKGGKVFVRNTLNINTENLEFSPAYYQNGIVYATSRYKQGIRDKKINETFFELFYAELGPEAMPMNAKEFSLQVNSHLHEGPVTFDRAGDMMYFTRNNLKKGLRKADSQGVTRLKIYSAKRGAFDWEEIKELAFNSDEFSCAHPTLSADGKKLYFASDRPGGHGGMDIYVVRKMAEGWSAPENLGEAVNTPNNEVFPFIHSSGQLFFASNGHDGLGGLDIYVTSQSGETFGNVKNMGEPFNSTADDLGLILSPDAKSGYFASARPGGMGKDDIYMFRIEEGLAGAEPETIEAKIVVIDKATGARIPGADIRVLENTPQGFIGGGNKLYEAVLMPAVEGSAELVFKLVRKDANSLGPADKISDTNGEAIYPFIGEKRYLILVTKDGYESGEKDYITVGNTGDTVIEIPLEKPKAVVPTTPSSIECSTLAGTVRDKTTNAIIPNAKVRIKNNCDGAEQIVYSDGRGNFTACLQVGCDYNLLGEKQNYINGLASVPNRIPGNLQTEVLLTPTSGSFAPTVGSVIVLENIFYDFNKSHIRAGAARELSELYDVMSNYPSMTIDLISHTDCRGDAGYNQRLSKKRAQSAKEFLVSRGISSSRISTKGMGESSPRIECGSCNDCTEENHQYNRRTEVKVVSIDNALDVQYGDNAPEVIDRKN